MRIIGYTYEADFHCVCCAVKRFGVSPQAAQSLPMTVDLDGNGIPIATTDCEGNEIHPVFSTDEIDSNSCCGDCRERIL